MKMSYHYCYDAHNYTSLHKVSTLFMHAYVKSPAQINIDTQRTVSTHNDATHYELSLCFLSLFLVFLPLQFCLDFAVSGAILHGEVADQLAECINLYNIHKKHNNVHVNNSTKHTRCLNRKAISLVRSSLTCIHKVWELKLIFHLLSPSQPWLDSSPCTVGVH